MPIIFGLKPCLVDTVTLIRTDGELAATDFFEGRLSVKNVGIEGNK